MLIRRQTVPIRKSQVMPPFPKIRKHIREFRRKYPEFNRPGWHAENDVYEALWHKGDPPVDFFSLIFNKDGIIGWDAHCLDCIDKGEGDPPEKAVFTFLDGCAPYTRDREPYYSEFIKRLDAPRSPRLA